MTIGDGMIQLQDRGDDTFAVVAVDHTSGHEVTLGWVTGHGTPDDMIYQPHRSGHLIIHDDVVGWVSPATAGICVIQRVCEELIEAYEHEHAFSAGDEVVTNGRISHETISDRFDDGCALVNRDLDNKNPRSLGEVIAGITARFSLDATYDGANVDAILLEYARAAYDLMRLDHPQRCNRCGAVLTQTPTGPFCHRCRIEEPDDRTRARGPDR